MEETGRQLERQDIFAKLNTNTLSIQIGKEFANNAKQLTTSEAIDYLNRLEAPYRVIRTSDNYSRYFDHFIFIFAPIPVLETAILIRNTTQALNSVDFICKNKLSTDLYNVLTEADTRKSKFTSHYDKINFEKIPSVVFVFENLQGDINNDKNYRFAGVFTAVPKDITGGVCRFATFESG